MSANGRIPVFLVDPKIEERLKRKREKQRVYDRQRREVASGMPGSLTPTTASSSVPDKIRGNIEVPSDRSYQALPKASLKNYPNSTLRRASTGSVLSSSCCTTSRIRLRRPTNTDLTIAEFAKAELLARKDDLSSSSINPNTSHNSNNSFESQSQAQLAPLSGQAQVAGNLPSDWHNNQQSKNPNTTQHWSDPSSPMQLPDQQQHQRQQPAAPLPYITPNSNATGAVPTSDLSHLTLPSGAVPVSEKNSQPTTGEGLANPNGNSFTSRTFVYPPNSAITALNGTVPVLNGSTTAGSEVPPPPASAAAAAAAAAAPQPPVFYKGAANYSAGYAMNASGDGNGFGNDNGNGPGNAGSHSSGNLRGGITGSSGGSSSFVPMRSNSYPRVSSMANIGKTYGHYPMHGSMDAPFKRSYIHQSSAAGPPPTQSESMHRSLQEPSATGQIHAAIPNAVAPVSVTLPQSYSGQLSKSVPQYSFVAHGGGGHQPVRPQTMRREDDSTLLNLLAADLGLHTVDPGCSGPDNGDTGYVDSNVYYVESRAYRGRDQPGRSPWIVGSTPYEPAPDESPQLIADSMLPDPIVEDNYGNEPAHEVCVYDSLHESMWESTFGDSPPRSEFDGLPPRDKVGAGMYSKRNRNMIMPKSELSEHPRHHHHQTLYP